MSTVITGYARTPTGKYGGALASQRAVELGGVAIAAALERSGVDPGAIDEVLMGQVLQAGEGQITSRQAAVRAGLSMNVPATTINKVCLSGSAAIASDFGNNATAAITLTETSWFKPWEKAVQKRARASQNASSTSARDFAEELMGYIKNPLRPEEALIGANSRKMVSLKRWLPTSILDAQLRKRFRLDKE